MRIMAANLRAEGQQSRAAIAMHRGAPAVAVVAQDARDAERFRQAIALEDNAEILHAATLNNAPDANAIRREFDAAILAAKGAAA